MSIWVIGDIHGCYDTFMALLKKLPEGDKICLVGDLIDRGPKSRQVVQYVIDNKIDCVKGNHEVMMVEQPDYWPLNGGMETLESYSSDLDGLYHMQLDKKLFAEHKEWMETLPTYLEYPDIKNENGRHLVVSHSILHDVWKNRNGTKQQQDQFYQTALWSRSFHKLKDNPEIFNIIGHTPQKYTVSATKIYANVDTGCCFTQFEEYGILSALKFPEMEVVTQENIEEKAKKVFDTDD